LKVIVEEYNLS